MRPNLEEYYPANLTKQGSNKELLKEKEAATQVGNLQLSQYVYHISDRWRSNTGARPKQAEPNSSSQVVHSVEAS